MFLKARGMELEGNISNLSASVSSTTVLKKGKRSKKQGASHEEGNNRGSGCNVECSRKEGLDSVQSITKEDVVKTHAQFQNVGSHSTTLETLTVQELRGMMREVGIPIRGTKRDLLSALKSFLDNQAEGRLSGQTSDALGLATISSAASMKTVSQKSTSSKRKVGHSSAGENQPVSLVSLDHVQNLGTVSEASGTLKKKSRGKPQILESANCNDTTASKAKKKMMAKFTNEDAGLVEGDGLSMTRSEPWTVLAHKKPQHGWVPYNPSTMRASPLADDVKTMKLMSWNVNGLRALLKLEGFSAVQLAQRENFDILCLQETKLQEKDVEDIKQCLISGYDDSFWSCSVSKLGYSGTAVISRIKPLSVRYGLGILDHDTEGRLITVEFDAFYLLSGYVPNSGDGLIRLTYRTKEWDPALGNYMKDLEKSKPVILTGDLNCAHQEIDIYNPAGNRRSAGFTDEERESFETNFLSRGFVDTFRRQHPCAIGYTYWGYRHGARKTNRGWRLDYFLASESIADQVHDSYILPDVVGSDHCPIGLTVKL